MQVVDRRVRDVVGAEHALRASADLSGVQLSATDMIARMTPSWSRSAMSWPVSISSAKASATSRVIGIGQSVPSARRMLVHDAVVVGLGQEALQRGEAAVHQQLEVADLPRRQVPGRKVARGGFGIGGLFAIEDQVNEFPTVWWDEMAGS